MRGIQGGLSRIVTEREEKLSWEAGAEEVSFKVFPKRGNRVTISYMGGKSSKGKGHSN